MQNMSRSHTRATNPSGTNLFGINVFGANLFGTDGIRGKIGTGLFVEEHLVTIGKAIGNWATQKYGAAPQLLITCDTRNSASFVKAALTTGLTQFPLAIHDCGVLPTPAMAHLIRRMPNINGAIIISASHNPFDDNGIKVMDAQGKLSAEDELTISSFIAHPAPLASPRTYGQMLYFANAQEQYVRALLEHFPSKTPAPKTLDGITIVLDTAHGATYEVAPKIFKMLGAQIITMHNQPNGFNINEACGALHLQSLVDTVKSTKAHIGFAFDGDGDRVMAVSAQGAIKDGDDMLALLLKHPAYQTTQTIVGTVMTNEGLAQLLTQKEKRLHRTAVGDKYIAQHLEENNLLLGGETSGHIILRDIIGTGDGILVALRVLETIKQTNNWSLETFTHFPQKTINVPITIRTNLTIPPCSELITQAQQTLGSGRILVRYSGTENVLRVMVEAQDEEIATSTCQQLAQKLAEQHG